MDDHELEVLLNEYDHAQDAAQHTDAVFWEITAIVWGANTLMLGFVLEAIQTKEASLLIEVSAVLGIVLNWIPPATYHSGKVGQLLAYKTCQDIEARLPTSSKLQTRIDEIYPKHFVQWLVYLVTITFAISWLLVGYKARGCFGVLMVFAVGILTSLLLFWRWKRGSKEK
jgi:hypothetical protein